MPNHEILHKAEDELDSSQRQTTNCSSGFAFMPADDEFFELLWENGEIVMKGQSGRTKKSSVSSSFSFDPSKADERDEGDAAIPMIDRFSNPPSVVNDFSPGLVHDHEMGPWLNYSDHDSLQSDCFAELYPNITVTGTNGNSYTAESNAKLSGSIGNGCVEMNENVVSAHGIRSHEHGKSSEAVLGVYEPLRNKNKQLFSVKQAKSLDSSTGPRISELSTNNDCFQYQPISKNLIQLPISTRAPNDDEQKNDPASTRVEETSKTSGLINFSHFLRPSNLFKANTLATSTSSSSTLSAESLKRIRAVYASGSNFIEPSLVASTKGSECLIGVQNLPSEKLDTKSCNELQQEMLSVEKSEVTCQKDSCRNDNRSNMSICDASCQSLSFAASVAIQRSENGKTLEPVVASSSMCSGNRAGESNEPKQAMKRKARRLEEIEGQSETRPVLQNVEESRDAKKTTKSKRSRTAEVHNLSERRRRDRINEKMRALQELIPNCNKVDKASMLDEAIEYIKTLQLQIQTMSMGSRFYMPPMTVPAGFQHLGSPNMTDFSPLVARMNAGMTAALGIPEVMFSSNCHRFPVPSVQKAQVPSPSVPGASNLHGMQASSLINPPEISEQHHPFRHPCPQYVSLSQGFSSKELLVSNASGRVTSVMNHDSSLPLSSKEQAKNINLQSLNQTSTSCSLIQSATEQTNEHSEVGLMQTSYPTSPVSGCAIKTFRKNVITSSGSD